MSSSKSVSRHDEMNEAHRRDYRFKKNLDAAISALDAVLADEGNSSLGITTAQEIIGVKLKLQRRSEHIVAVWD